MFMWHFLVLCVCQLSYESKHRSIFGGYFVCQLLACPSMAEEEVTEVVVDNSSCICKKRCPDGDTLREMEVCIQKCILYIAYCVCFLYMKMLMLMLM